MSTLLLSQFPEVMLHWFFCKMAIHYYIGKFPKRELCHIELSKSVD